MIVAKYQGFEIIHVYGLTQYDYGQILHIENIDISEDTEIHFCQGNKAIIQYIKDNQVAIPDYLLQYSQQINAYIYLIEGSTGKTIIKIILPIKSRERPGDYVTPEEPAYSRLLPTNGLPGQTPIRQSGSQYAVEWGYRADNIKYDDGYMQLMSGDIPIGERIRIMGIGREIEFTNDGTTIKWRYTDSNEWHDLVNIDSLKGDQGIPGITPKFEIRNGHLFVKYEEEGEV